MLELMLLSLCIDHFQTVACQNAGSAYYKQSGDETMIYNYGQRIQMRYKDYEQESVAAGVIYNLAYVHQYTGRLASVKGIDILCTVGTTTNLITFKKALP